MLKQTKCCNSHLCINHKDGGGRGKCKYLRNFASFLTHIFIANCTINKHRMRNINLKFLWYLDTLHTGMQLLCGKNLLKSFVKQKKLFNVCPTNFLVFFFQSGQLASFFKPLLYTTPGQQLINRFRRLRHRSEKSLPGGEFVNPRLKYIITFRIVLH